MSVEEITKILGLKKNDKEIYFDSNKKPFKKGLYNGYDDTEGISVNTLKVIENTYYTDRFCDVFNYLNFYTKKIQKKKRDKIIEGLNYVDRDLWYAFKLAEMHTEEFEEDFSFRQKYKEYFCDYNTFCLSAEAAVFLNYLLGKETVSKVFEDSKINTYNGETIIDRGLLIVYGLEYKNTIYTLLAYHAGGDIRGGYYNYFMVVGDIDEVACFYPSAAYIKLQVTGNKKNPLYKSIVEKSDGVDGVFFIDETNNSDVSITGYIDFKDYFINTLKFTEEEYNYLRENCKMTCNY